MTKSRQIGNSVRDEALLACVFSAQQSATATNPRPLYTRGADAAGAATCCLPEGSGGTAGGRPGGLRWFGIPAKQA